MADSDTSTARVKRARKRRGTPRPNIREVSKGTQFKKNDPATGYKDPRINRKGFIKPRSQRELEALLDDLFDESVTVRQPGGRKEQMDALRAMLQRLMNSKQATGAIELLNRRFGKIPTPVQVENVGMDIVKVVGVDTDQL